MNNQPRVYTYKITFEEVPYYYYGSHKEKRYNEYYMGSPVTNKWCWKLYTPKKQILELFKFSDDGYVECRKVEDRLINPVLNDPWCLNEGCGGSYSLKIRREVGIQQFILKKGIHSQTRQEKVEMGKELWYSGKGLASIGEEQWKYNASLGGSTGAGGRVVGKMMYDQRKGIFSLSEIELSENGKLGAKKTNSQKWQCTITGHISTSAGLSNYQKSRKIDTSNRVRIK
jgi:hypothetical protein